MRSHSPPFPGNTSTSSIAILRSRENVNRAQKIQAGPNSSFIFLSEWKIYVNENLSGKVVPQLRGMDLGRGKREAI